MCFHQLFCLIGCRGVIRLLVNAKTANISKALTTKYDVFFLSVSSPNTQFFIFLKKKIRIKKTIFTSCIIITEKRRLRNCITFIIAYKSNIKSLLYSSIYNCVIYGTSPLYNPVISKSVSMRYPLHVLLKVLPPLCSPKSATSLLRPKSVSFFIMSL